MTQVTATDADDPTYGNSARVVYSILHGQPYFSVDPKTGERTPGSIICTLCFIQVYTFDRPPWETKVCSNVETFGCSFQKSLNRSVMLVIFAIEAFIKCPTQLHKRHYIIILHFTVLHYSAFLLWQPQEVGISKLELDFYWKCQKFLTVFKDDCPSVNSKHVWMLPRDHMFVQKLFIFGKGKGED